MYIYIYIYIHIYVCVCVCVCVCVYPTSPLGGAGSSEVDIYIHKHTHTHTYIYIVEPFLLFWCRPSLNGVTRSASAHAPDSDSMLAPLRAAPLTTCAGSWCLQRRSGRLPVVTVIMTTCEAVAM